MIDNDGRTRNITLPKDRSGLKERWIDASQDQLNALEAEFIFGAQKKYLLSTVHIKENTISPIDEVWDAGH